MGIDGGGSGEHLTHPVAFPQQPSSFHSVGLKESQRIRVSHAPFDTISVVERVM